MAPRKQTPKTLTSSTTEKKPRWISVELTANQKEDMKSRLSTLTEMNEWLLRMLEQDYKVTLAWDSYNEAYATFVYPVGEEHPNNGHVLSNRGSSPVSALRGALYRHFVVFDGTWGNRDRSPIDDD